MYYTSIISSIGPIACLLLMSKSKFVHLIDNRHAIGPMEEIMEVLHKTKKGKMMNTYLLTYLLPYLRTYSMEQSLS